MEANEDNNTRVYLARKGVLKAKKPVSQGGIGAGGGIRAVEKHREALISNLNGGPGATREAIEKAIRQADGLLPFLEDGYCALFIADPEDKSWCYGPIMINPSGDEEEAFDQIKFAQSRHRTSFPNHYVAANTANWTPSAVATRPAQVPGQTTNPVNNDSVARVTSNK